MLVPHPDTYSLGVLTCLRHSDLADELMTCASPRKKSQSSNLIVEQIKMLHLPLHCACFSQADPAVVKALLACFPRGAQVRSTSGYLPLHFCCSHS